MLQSVGRKTTHAGQTTITVTSSHVKVSVVQAAMKDLTRFFKELAITAEQLGVTVKVRLIGAEGIQEIIDVFTTHAYTQITASDWVN